MRERRRRFRGALAGIGGLALVPWLNKAADDQLLEDHPQVVFATRRSNSLREMAMRLASEGRTDTAAMQELRAAANGHDKDLLRAAADIRLGSNLNEHRQGYLANELLIAASEDREVKLPSPEQSAWFDDLEDLEALPDGAAFGRLAQQQPELAEFQRFLLTRSVQVRRESQQTYEDVMWDTIVDGLEPIVGPSAGSKDRLLRSRVALDCARIYLARMLGLHFSDDELPQ